MTPAALDKLAAELRADAKGLGKVGNDQSLALLSAAAKAERLRRALEAAGVTRLPLEPDPKELLDARWAAAIEASYRAFMPISGEAVRETQRTRNMEA